MNRMLRLASRLVAAPLTRLQERFVRSRRGSVLIMVVALLVLLALMGTAYLTSARLDRVAAINDRNRSGLQDEIAAALDKKVQSLIDEIGSDTDLVTHPLGSTSYEQGAAGGNISHIPVASTNFLATSTPQIISDPTTGMDMTSATTPASTPMAPVYAWRMVSRPSAIVSGIGNATTIHTPRFISPYVASANPLFTYQPEWYEQEDYSTGTTSAPTTFASRDYWWFIPAHIAIYYDNSNGKDPNIPDAYNGRTRVFPAFNRVHWVGTGATRTLEVELVTSTPASLVSAKVGTAGIQPKLYLAADASGAGVADAALIPLSGTEPPALPALPTPIGTTDIQFYYAYRVVDEASKLNVNAAAEPSMDEELGTIGTGNCRNFFPAGVNLRGLFHNTLGAGESNLLYYNNWLYGYINPPPPPLSAFDRMKDATEAPKLAVVAQPFEDQVIITNPPLARNDFRYLPFGFLTAKSAPADAAWHQYTRRLALPGIYDNQKANGATYNKYGGGGRSFGSNDAQALVYRGGVMTNPDANRSSLESQLYTLSSPPSNFPSTDSIYGWAMNAVATKSNAFKFLTAADSAYWFDYNYYFNPNPVIDSNGNSPWFYQYHLLPAPYADNAQKKYGLGGSVGALVPDQRTGFTAQVPGPTQMGFRSPRSLITALNPVFPKATNSPTVKPNPGLDLISFPDTVRPYVDNSGKAIPNPVKLEGSENLPNYVDANFVSKTSLNTAAFPELWRAFVSVMAERPVATGAGATEPYFHVPGTAPSLAVPPPDATNMFRNSLRDPAGAAAVGGVKFDKYNMLLLRAALAAVNTIDMRDADGMTAAGEKVGNVTSRHITLTTTAGTPVEVTVYGQEAQPFIGEIFVDTDIVSKGDKYTGGGGPGMSDPDHNGVNDSPGKVNPMGFVAVELFNPYPFSIDIANYRFAVIERQSGGTAGKLPIKLVGTTGKITAGGAGSTSIAAGGSVVISNYAATGGGAGAANYVPYATKAGMSVAPDPTKFLYLEGLEQVLEGGGATTPLSNKGGELVILRPHQPQAGTPSVAVDGSYDEGQYFADMVPVDAYDFTGMVTGNAASAKYYHYMRQTGVTGAEAWKCVYPGKYDPALTPRNAGTHESAPFDPSMGADSWQQTGDPVATTAISLGSNNANASYPNPYLGIALNNFSWGTGFKPTANSVTGPNVFPFGGFARTGDVLQVPCIGSYRVLAPTVDGSKSLPQGTGGVTVAQGSTNLGGSPLTTTTGGGFAPQDYVMEMNPVTMDVLSADDGDTTDDQVEQVGRFCPIHVGTINDYDAMGHYPSDPAQNGNTSTHAYRWAMRVTEMFTSIACPSNDYMPNVDASRDLQSASSNPLIGAAKYPPGDALLQPRMPQPVPNGVGGIDAATANGGREERTPVEGLINVNTASWRVLAAVEMVPRTADIQTGPGTSGGLNEQLAKLIVHYRDVDDGSDATRPHPHGPFHSLLELNDVFDPAAPPGPTRNGFANAMGTLPTGATPPDAAFGLYAAGTQTGTGGSAIPTDDFQSKYLMVNRVSNLLTTRSDTFTVYVVVQAWRNVGTPYPILLGQKRATVIVDRSQTALGTGTTPSKITVPAN